MAKKKKKHRLLKAILLILLLLLGAAAYLRLSAGAVIPARDGETASFAHTLNVLLIGADYNEVGVSEGRSDCIMLLSCDLRNGRLHLLSVPRDTYAEVKGHGKTKINHAYAYGGVELLRESLRQLLGVPVDYYAAVNFHGFEQLIDAMGGIDIEVDKDMDYRTYYDHIKLEKGFQHLDGVHALQFVRYRHDTMGDIRRVQRQQLFMQAVLEKLGSFEGIKSLPSLVMTALEIIETDMPKQDIARVALSFVGRDLGSLETQTLPGDFVDIGGVSYWKMNENKWREMTEEIFSQ